MPETQTEYLKMEAVKLGDNQIAFQTIGVFDSAPKIIAVLTEEEFRAAYRMIFEMIKDELDKPKEE